MVVQLVYANQAGKWCFRGYVVRSLDCPGLWRLCENGDTGCPLHHKGTAKAWEQNDRAIAHRPYHPGHIPSYYDTNFSHDSFIGRLNRFLGAEVQRFFFPPLCLVGFRMGQKEPAAMCTRAVYRDGLKRQCMCKVPQLTLVRVLLRVVRSRITTPDLRPCSSTRLTDSEAPSSFDFWCWLMDVEIARSMEYAFIISKDVGARKHNGELGTSMCVSVLRNFLVGSSIGSACMASTLPRCAFSPVPFISVEINVSFRISFHT